MPKTVILSAARTPIGKLGGGLASLDATELGATAISGRAGAGRGRARRGPARRHGAGAAGRSGSDPVAPGPDQGRDPQGGLLGDDQQGVRVRDPCRRDDRRRRCARATSTSPSRAAWSRCRTRPTCSSRRPFRLPDGRRQDARRDDRGRPDEPVQRQQMFDEATEVGAELELTRADLDRWALRSHQLAIKATDEGRLPDEIVPVTVTARKGETVVEVDEAPRRDSTLESLSKLPRSCPQGGLAHRRQLAGCQRRWRRAGARLRRAGPTTTASACWRRSSPRPRSPTTSPTWPAPRPRRRRRRWRRSARPPTTSTCGRSTRRSRPSR